MQVFQQIFRLYIYGSMHVALSVVALVAMTLHMFGLPADLPMFGFAFGGTMFSYNFMKYEAFYKQKWPAGKFKQVVVVLSTIALAFAGICFLCLKTVTQLTALAFLLFTALYTVPFFPNTKNLRNWSGIKIYIVALCWAGVTTLLPLINAGVDLSSDVYLKFMQRFLLVIILILIFEIIDLKEDDPFLKTIPQQIGVLNTKILNLVLLFPFYFLEFLKTTIDREQLLVNILLITVTALFTIFADPQRHKYYTLFWVESIPIFWLGMVVLFC
ncbi:MAG: hypothetical protein ACO1N9_08220 [Flavobacterium sp.]